MQKVIWCGMNETEKRVAKMLDDSPFTVWKSDNRALYSLPNGLVLRIENRCYRIGVGYGPENYEDNFQPVFKYFLLENTRKP